MSGTESQSHAHSLESTQSLNAVVGVDSVELNMGTSEKPKKNQDVTGKSKRKIREPAPVKEGLTTVAHCCVLAYVLLILYLCFKQPFEFFTWHPLLLSLGWMLLMGEAILAISKENKLTEIFKVTHTLRLRLHWVPFTVAAVLIAAGFVIVTINKNRLNKFHYTSWHGLFGLLGVITYTVPCINGVLTLYNKELKDYLNPKRVKLIHVVTGTLCFVFGAMSLILSVYTKWFARRTNNNPYVFSFGLLVVTFPIVWMVQRPLIKCVKNIYKMFADDE